MPNGFAKMQSPTISLPTTLNKKLASFTWEALDSGSRLSTRGFLPKPSGVQPGTPWQKTRNFHSLC
jgi:hypothetical protein